LQHTYNVKVATRHACIDLETLGNIQEIHITFSKNV